MHPFVKEFSRLPAAKAIDDAFADRLFPVAAFGLSAIHKTLLTAMLTEKKKTVTVFVADEGEGMRMRDDLTALKIRAEFYPRRDFSFSAEKFSRGYEQQRIGVLQKIASGDCDAVVTTPMAAFAATVPPDVLRRRCFVVKAGKSDIDVLTESVIGAGYTRVDTVDAPGQFARRGGIFDLYPTNSAVPYRLDFWGDEIDSIHTFDIESQRRIMACDGFTVTPSVEFSPGDPAAFAEKLKAAAARCENPAYREHIYEDIEKSGAGIGIPYERYMQYVYETRSTLFDYTRGGILVFSESSGLEERFLDWEKLTAAEIGESKKKGFIAEDFPPPYLSSDELINELSGSETVFAETFPRKRFFRNPATVCNFTVKQIPQWDGQPSIIKEETLPGDKTVILAGDEKAAGILTDRLTDEGMPAIFAKNPRSYPAGITVTTGSLSQGFSLPDCKFNVIAFKHTGGGRHKPRHTGGIDIGAIEDLEPGDLVVHATHGIGRFEGVTQLKTRNGTKDYIKILYRDNGILYVPTLSLDMISKYIGSGDENVQLSALGSSDWTKAKKRARKSVKDIAKQLTSLYAKRMATKGYAFSPDDDMQRDFESRFVYEETDDQLKAVREIKDDMERGIPMDRLLCGDVGFGKTEVAFRAAFKCIADGKQCAFLVPTTILAWQHYNTAVERFRSFPVNIEMLSRFRTAAEQTAIKRKLKSGSIDLLIGTHRMIGGDIEFRDLGLLVIDEEQRFGVAQKERLKEKFPSVDVLTVSATPIPRTLNLSLSGLRDMSSIEEAPGDRHPVQTFVMEQDMSVLNAAIDRELRRGGQVFYLHNRVESIYSVAGKIASSFPGAAVEVAHGRMNEDELSEIWKRMVEQEIDILVCTTIIEAGIDIPNANTLIIENADRFGLAQLHQLRGRVGRSRRHAYAYLCFPPYKSITETASERLDAIRKYTEFGSGFKIAMRDLEIRGAGNLLGGEQSGNMNAVGYDMYIHMLNEALKEERGEPVKEKISCTVDISVSANIPESYIVSQPQRLEIYRRIASVQSPSDADDVRGELRDRFGRVPAPVENLITVALYKSRASSYGVTDIQARNGSIVMYTPLPCHPQLSQSLAQLRGRVMVSAGTKPYITVHKKTGESDLGALGEIFAAAPAKN